jgi:hypothetical protein
VRKSMPPTPTDPELPSRTGQASVPSWTWWSTPSTDGHAHVPSRDPDQGRAAAFLISSRGSGTPIGCWLTGFACRGSVYFWRQTGTRGGT